jgi:hypothetical protein
MVGESELVHTGHGPADACGIVRVMEHPKHVGDRSTLAIMLALQESGYAVYVPFGENTRADLIIEKESRLASVQCKTGRLRNGAVTFKVCSSYAHHPHPRVPKRNYTGEVDYLAVYCTETGSIYLVPIADVAIGWNARLRIDPPRNNQRKRIRLASAYELGVVDLSVTAAPDANAGAG